MAILTSEDRQNDRKTSSRFKPNWYLADLDTKPYTIIRPQFPIDFNTGVTVPFGGVVAQQPRFGFSDPIIQWVQGKTKVFSFSTVLFAAHANDKEQMEKLLSQFEQIATKDEDLGRSHIVQFVYGKRSKYSVTCLVQDADQQIVSMHDDGTPREVRISLTLIKYVPFSTQQIDLSKLPKESYHLVVSASERSYEAIARAFYGQPLLGDRLRKRNPQSPLAPEVGETVHVPDRSTILQEIVQPEAHMLSLTDKDAVDNFERILEDRNNRRLVFVS